jgi:hypothetical protein
MLVRRCVVRAVIDVVEPTVPYVANRTVLQAHAVQNCVPSCLLSHLDSPQ